MSICNRSLLKACAASTVVAIMSVSSSLAYAQESTPAQAPTEPQAAASDVADIIVTANKRSENINKVGLSISAVTAETLSERKITSLEDVASIAPGLIYTPSTNNTPIFTLRGIGFNESSLGVYPAVSVYVDQIPLPFPVMASHSAYDLERVEVLKGPQGTLFGQNSTGGAINYIAAKPTKALTAGGDISFGRFNQIDGNAFISGPISSNAGFRVAVTGLHSDDWQYSYTRNDTNGHKSYIAGRAILDWEPTDRIKLNFTANGWQDKSQPQAQQLIAVHETVSGAGGPGATNSPAVNDPIRNYYSPPLNGAASGQLGYPFSPFNARAADWSSLNLDPSAAVQLNDGSGGTAIGNAGLTSFDPYSNRRFWQAAVRADIEFGSVTLTSLTSYAQFKQHQAADGDGMYYVGFDVPQDDGSLKSFNQELRLASDTTQALRWIVGANFEKSKTYEEQTLRYFGNSNYSPGNLYINSSSDRLNQDIRNYAFFGDLEYRLGRLTLKGSARYTNSRNNAVNLPFAKDGTSNLDKLFNILGGLSGFSFTPIGPGQSVMLNSTPASLPSGVTLNFPTQSGNLGLGVPGYALDASLKEHNVSWRVGLDYQATSDVLLYANVSRGYKAGSFPVLAPSQIVSALPVNQESVTAYEAGIKASFMDRKVQFNAAGFYNDYRNKQVKGKLYDFVFGTLDALVNVPKSRIWGAEAQLTVRPIEGLTIDGSATYLNSKVTKYYGYDIYGGISNSNFVPGSPGNQEDLSGNPLPYTPKWSGAINVDYKRHLASGGAPFIGVTVNARSGQDAAIGGGSTTLPTGPRYRIADGVGPFPYTIASYATVDARLGYEAADGNWRVMLWGKNIFDKYYWNAVVPSSDSDGRLAGMPATYGVTFGFKFN